MPYYGPTTQYQHLTNFMKKKGRTKGDFKGLFGFNPFTDGIDYKMIQASSKVLATNNIAVESREYENYTVIFNATNSNTATMIFVNDETEEQTIMDYIYSTEKFPSIHIVEGDNDGQYMKKLSIESGEYMANIISLTARFFSDSLWEIYEVKHEDD